MKKTLDTKIILSNGGKIEKGKGPHIAELKNKHGKHVKWISKKEFDQFGLKFSD